MSCAVIHRVAALGALSLMVSIASAAAAASYYVAPGGNDAGPGSEAEPWQTLAHAVGALAPGDTLFLRAGTYAEQLVPTQSGADGQPITIAAYAGEEPVIDGSGISLDTMTGLVDISDLSHVTIQGLHVQHAGPNENAAGILVSGSSDILVQSNHTLDTTSSGVGVWGSDHVVVDNNEIELACNDGSQECISIGQSDTFEIRFNHVHDGGPGNHGGEGIDSKDGSTNGRVYGNHVHDVTRVGIYVDAWDKATGNIDVFANVVHACSSGIDIAAEAGGTLTNVRVFNNNVWGNRNVGVWVAQWGVDGATHAIDGLLIVNNTVGPNGTEGWGGGIYVDNPAATNVTVRNNLVSQNPTWQIGRSSEPAGLSIDHNLIDGFRGDPEETYGTAYVEGDPRFVDAATQDYHLAADSPAIDQGSAEGAPTDDFDGKPRPLLDGYDIGAFEFGEAPTGGAGGTGASGAGGMGAGGGNGASAGAGASAGSGALGPAGAGNAGDEGGCGCRLPVHPSAPGSVLLSLGVLASAICARRRWRPA